jgi:hypothetical protein
MPVTRGPATNGECREAIAKLIGIPKDDIIGWVITVVESESGQDENAGKSKVRLLSNGNPAQIRDLLEAALRSPVMTTAEEFTNEVHPKLSSGET